MVSLSLVFLWLTLNWRGWGREVGQIGSGSGLSLPLSDVLRCVGGEQAHL